MNKDGLILLEEKMRNIYKSYCEQCEAQNISPYVPTVGYYAFMAAGLALPGSRQDPYDAMDRVLTEYDLKDFSPAFKLRELHQMLSYSIYPKYKEAISGRWGAKRDVNLQDINERHFYAFLVNHEEFFDNTIDSNLLIIATRLLAPFPLIKLRGQTWNDMNFSNSLNRLLQRYPTLLHQFCSIKDNKFVFNFGQFQEELENIFLMHSQESPHMMTSLGKDSLEEAHQKVFSRLNKLLAINGKQVYTIQEHGKLLDKHLSNWFNVVHKLCSVEKQKWKETAPQLSKFIQEYEYALKQLDIQNTIMYSGVAEGPYSVQLIKTSKKEKEEDKEYLKGIVAERVNLHHSEIQDYLDLKPYATVLKQAVSWFEDIFDSLKKKGRR
jgi:hypothetical protein